MRKKLLYSFIILLLIGGSLTYWAYTQIFSANVALEDNTITFDIPSGSSFEEVTKLLSDQDIIIDEESFKRVAGLMNYTKAEVPSGRYTISNGSSNKALISKLRSGNQSAVKITFNQVRTFDQLCGRITDGIELDSVSFNTYVYQQINKGKIPYDRDNILTLFLPNTYEVYWNISADKLLAKMERYHSDYWNNPKRKAALDSLNLTEIEAYILASIVEKETLAAREKSTIAGVYYNRIKKGMKLEADPTVVFATGLFDLRRVLFKHLEYDSPYNTYMYEGLPPGPIFMPDLSTIDATLNAEDHQYIFFCAKPDNSGLHAFASTNAGHEANARRYRHWLNKNRIR